MTDSTSTSHTTSDATSINTKCKRKTRGCTMYTKVKKAHKSGVCYPNTYYIRSDGAYDENVEDLMGYIVLQSRSKVSILIDNWNEVDEDLKDDIWDDVTEVLNVSPDDSMVKKKLLTYVGERWRGFKTHLSHDYIKYPKEEDEPKCKPPYLMYSFIDQDVWEKFVKSRTTPEFLAKSQKGKENRARNIYPHRLSRGGYQKLEKTVIEEKIKQKELELGDSIILDYTPFLPVRHEKWKKAHQTKDYEFTSDATHEVAQKIISRYFFQQHLF
ncbi:unnamed protein product [Lathyrus oleraceus]